MRPRLLSNSRITPVRNPHCPEGRQLDHGGDHGELTMGMMLTDQNKVVVKSDCHTK